MKKYIIALLLGLSVTGSMTQAQTSSSPTITLQDAVNGDFTKKRYTVHGTWEIVTIDGKKAIRFSDSFKTKNGPDLKVFLSPAKLESLGKKTDVSNAVNIGVLKSNKGEQTYTLPEGIKLSDYSSLLIHCEAYSVLWGGFDIPQ